MIKGIGASQEVQTTSVRSAAHATTYELLKPAKRVEGTPYPLRFHTQKTTGIEGRLGFGEEKLALKRAQEVTKELDKKGLRTRRLILTGQYGDRVIFMTPSGPQKAQQVEAALGYRPGLELWAMRSRYRCEDLLNTSILRDNQAKWMRPVSEFINYDDLYKPVEDPYHVRARNELKFSQQQREATRAMLDPLAREVVKRAQQDNAPRFLAIGEKYKNLTQETFGEEFWLDYMTIFAELLGEQVGIMYREGAFTARGYLNAQNITLLAEIVDHDVTYFDPSKKTDPVEVAYQFHQTISTLTHQLTALYACGALPEETDMGYILDLYAGGIVASLNTSDRKSVGETLEEYIDQTIEPITRFRPYQNVVSSIQSLDPSHDHATKLKIRETQIKDSIQHSLNPDRTKKEMNSH